MRLKSCGSAREVVAEVAVVVVVVEAVVEAVEAAVEAAAEEAAEGEVEEAEAVEAVVGFHHFHLDPSQDTPSHARTPTHV